MNPTSIGANRGEVPLHGLRLRVLQALWVILVLCDLIVLIVGLPAFYRALHTVCTLPIAADCSGYTDQLAPRALATLQHAGLSLHAYALYVFTFDMLTSLAFLFVGAVIIWRKANSWMGLFVSFFLLNFGSLGVSTGHFNALQAMPSDNAFVLLGTIVGGPLSGLAYLCLAFFFFTFPDGRLVPRWSWALVSLWIVNFVFWVAPPNAPFNILNWPPLLQSLWLFIVFGGSLATQVYRYRRVASPVQRQQIKWLIYGFAPALFLPIFFGLVLLLLPALSSPDSLWSVATQPLFRFYYLPIPFCIGIALLRYRLWDIDLIINRTLVYGALSACVIGVYVLVVVALGTLLQAQGNLVLSLLATGLIAVLFQPLRLRLQRGVNRLMYGERDEPYAVLARLGNRLEATLVPEKVLPTIVETVAQALKLPYVAIALLPEGHSLTLAGAQQTDIVASSGTPTADLVRVPLVYQAERVGYLLLAARAGDTFGKADKRLLTDLARQAGVAVYAVRLTTHLQHLTVSLQQAREHLVTTREEERRRLRRDLHDGLGPTLASLTFKIDAAHNLLKTDNERTESLLDSVRQQAQEAIRDIRRLVYNLRPPALDEFGLLSALREQAALYQHQGLEVVFDAPPSLPPLPAAVEVAAYRISQEALTNVARHAEAQQCLLRLYIDSNELSLDIRDDGQGIPAGHRIGVGLHTMHERASELGGSCIIIPGSPGGTTIQVRLPLTAARDALPTSVYTVQPEQESIPVSDMSLVRQEE